MNATLTVHGMTVAGTARDGLEALEKARALNPDFILMDIRMPNLDGFAADRLIKKELSHVKIVMFTMSLDGQDLNGSGHMRGQRLPAQDRRSWPAFPADPGTDDRFRESSGTILIIACPAVSNETPKAALPTP